MILSTTTTYALRILTTLAQAEGRLLSAADINCTTGIARQYLRRQLTKLANAGVIISHRGKSGGFRLAKAANSIFISEIIEIIDGLESLNACILGLDECKRETRCELHTIWTEPKQKLLETFSTTSIAMMLET